MRYVDEAEVAQVLRMPELIPAMRQAMVDYSRGRITQPARTVIEVETTSSQTGFFVTMPAAGPEISGAKLVTYYPGNAERDLHTHHAEIVLFRTATGEPLATMAGSLITEMRTAAMTAAFVDAVAPREVHSLAVLGAGAQARSHIEALRCVRDFEEVRIWNRTPARAQLLAGEVGGRATSCEEAVRGAEVVVAVTGSAAPVFDGRWLRPGAVVASAGWAGSEGGELDAETMSNVVLVDSREGTAAGSGNIRRFGVEPFAEVGEIFDGSRSLEPGATVVFDSIGMACQDLAAASLVWNHVQE